MRLPPLLAIVAGFVLWSILFLLLYAVQATGCHLSGGEATANNPTLLRWLLAGLFLAFLGGMWVLYRRDRGTSEGRERGFVGEVTSYVWIAALIATPFCFAGIFWLTLCGS